MPGREQKEVLKDSSPVRGVGPAGRAYVAAPGRGPHFDAVEEIDLSAEPGGGSLADPKQPHGEITKGSHADFIFHRLLALADLGAIVLAATASALIAADADRPTEVLPLALTVAVMVPVWFFIAYTAGLYHEVERRIDHNFVDEIGTITIAATAWCWLFTLTRSLLVDGGTPLLAPALMWLMVVPLLLIFRALVRRHARRQPWNLRPVATIGDEAGVAALTQRIDRHPEWGLDVQLKIETGTDLGYLITESRDGEKMVSLMRFPDPTVPYDGRDRRGAKERAIAARIKESGVDRAIIAGEFQDLYSRTRLIHELIERGVAVDHISGGPETLYSKAVFHDLEGLPVLSVRPTSPRPLAQRIKRVFDVLISGFGLLALSPVLAWAAIRIKLDSEGPVFYRQTRCGLNGEAFEVLKLRTMVVGAHDMRSELRRETEAAGNDDVLFKLEDDPRVTGVGRFLRRTSLDEVPQLWNVFRGDMSMVGPRPLVFEEARQATDLFTARTRVRPGIAGPWQALGRSSIPFEDMIKLDYAYVVGWSMSEDIRLLLRTVTAVTKRNGAL